MMAPLVAAAATEAPIELITPTGTLYGTALSPAETGRTLVALIVAGSGPTDRDGNSPMAAGRNNSLKLLAEALAASGFASVRYDKRGIAASVTAGPRESELRFGRYVDDAAAWIQQLSNDDRYDGVVVIGHSEGALIGLLASQASAASAWIGLAAPAQKAADLLRRQLHGQLPASLAERNEFILAELEAGRTVADVPAELAPLYRPSVQAYLISWFGHSPEDALAALALPCLLVQGDTDIQVRVEDAKALKAAQPICEMAIIAGMNHVLKAVPADLGQQLASYGDPALPLAPALVTVLNRFLSGVASRSAVGGAEGGAASCRAPWPGPRLRCGPRSRCRLRRTRPESDDPTTAGG